MSPSRPAYSPNVAQVLQDHLLGGGRRDPAEVGGRVVVLARLGGLALGLGLVGGRLGGPHGDVAGLAVELDTGLRSGALSAVVRDQQCFLDRLDHEFERDVLFTLETAQSRHIDVHEASP